MAGAGTTATTREGVGLQERGGRDRRSSAAEGPRTVLCRAAGHVHRAGARVERVDGQGAVALHGGGGVGAGKIHAAYARDDIRSGRARRLQPCAENREWREPTRNGD